MEDGEGLRTRGTAVDWQTAPMNVTLGEVSDLVGALAWPAAALVIVIIFRRPLKALLTREDVQVSAFGGLTISARGQAAAARELVDAARSRQDATVDLQDAEIGVQVAARGVEVLGRHPQILWVDDRPSLNQHEVAALHALGMHVSLSASTEDALRRFRTQSYDLVVSDMGRPPDARAGYTLLNALRGSGDLTPFVIYASSDRPEHFDEAVRRGASGSTNRPDELVRMVSNALWRASQAPQRRVTRRRAARS